MTQVEMARIIRLMSLEDPARRYDSPRSVPKASRTIHLLEARLFASIFTRASDLQITQLFPLATTR